MKVLFLNSTVPEEEIAPPPTELEQFSNTHDETLQVFDPPKVIAPA
jgi:hypothetical protein